MASSQQKLAHRHARDWWAANPSRASAICDRCNAEIKRNQGCLIQGTGLVEGMLSALTSDKPNEIVLTGGTDLICDDCFSDHTPANFKAGPAAAQDKTWDDAPFGPTSMVLVVITSVIAGAFGAISPFRWPPGLVGSSEAVYFLAYFFVAAIISGYACAAFEKLKCGWLGVLLPVAAAGFGSYFYAIYDPSDLRLADDFQAQHLALSHDGKLALAAKGTEIRCWDAKTGQRLHTFQARSPVDRLAFSKEGLRVLAFEAKVHGKASVYQAWEATTGKEVAAAPGDLLTTSKQPPKGLFWISWKPRPDTALQIDGNDIVLPEGPKGTPVRLKGHTGPVRRVNLSPDLRWGLSWGDDNWVRVWRMTNAGNHPIGEEYRSWRATDIEHLRFSSSFSSSDGGYVLAAGARRIQVWSAVTDKLVHTFKQKWTEPNLGDLAYSGDGQTILTADGANVRVWRLPE